MGTNYYHTSDACPICGRSDRLHIGKSSGGWTFSFRGYKGHPVFIKSWRDWIYYFEQEGTITNEYNGVVQLLHFKELVERKKIEIRNHAKLHIDENCWIDDEGYGFQDSEFS